MAGLPQLEGIVRSNLTHMQVYEQGSLQQQALAVIPVAELESRTATGGRDALLRELLRWFKHEFFSWVDTIRCDSCNSSTEAKGMLSPTAEDRQWGAGRVEAHRCTACGLVTRFPRYNHPGKLLQTRYILDLTDHVWVEVFSETNGRWLHADPCENACDTPMLYEAGWGKKLTYVLAFELDCVTDVTWRYTAKREEVLKRRTMCSEGSLIRLVRAINAACSRSQLPARRTQVTDRMIVELATFVAGHAVSSGSVTLPGRQTGTLEWRQQRGETGSN